MLGRCWCGRFGLAVIGLGRHPLVREGVSAKLVRRICKRLGSTVAAMCGWGVVTLLQIIHVSCTTLEDVGIRGK